MIFCAQDLIGRGASSERVTSVDVHYFPSFASEPAAFWISRERGTLNLLYLPNPDYQATTAAGNSKYAVPNLNRASTVTTEDGDNSTSNNVTRSTLVPSKPVKQAPATSQPQVRSNSPAMSTLQAISQMHVPHLQALRRLSLSPSRAPPSTPLPETVGKDLLKKRVTRASLGSRTIEPGLLVSITTLQYYDLCLYRFLLIMRCL